MSTKPYPVGEMVILTYAIDAKCIGHITVTGPLLKTGAELGFASFKKDMLHQQIGSMPWSDPDWIIYHPIEWMRPYLPGEDERVKETEKEVVA